LKIALIFFTHLHYRKLQARFTSDMVNTQSKT